MRGEEELKTSVDERLLRKYVQRGVGVLMVVRFGVCSHFAWPSFLAVCCLFYFSPNRKAKCSNPPAAPHVIIQSDFSTVVPLRTLREYKDEMEEVKRGRPVMEL